MPQLPSGLKIAISSHAILEPRREFFRCPEGHFWYQTTDLSINRPPFRRGRPIIMDFAHAPVPETREEVKQYLHVLVGDEEGKFHWEGQLLSEFPRPGQLDDADREAWEHWLAREDSQKFLDEAIEQCRIQAEANPQNTGQVRVAVVDGDDGRMELVNRRFHSIRTRVAELESEANGARTDGDHDRGLEIYTELERLLASVRELRETCDGGGAVGAHLEGYVHRVLERWAEAEAAFREALQNDPYHADSWLEITWCLASQGLLADAEEAARRTVQVMPDSCEAWGNLAMTLLWRRKSREARTALDTALALNPDDAKNRAIDASFEAFLAMPAITGEAN